MRPTVDVDCVVDLTTTAEYYAFVARLRKRGFTECRDENAPLCRLVYAGIRVDMVATADTGVGPTNRWYRDAVAEAALHRLADDLEVRAITPLFFVASKLEAFRGRGGGDYFASHDLEDTLMVLAGLPDLRDQIARDHTAVARSVRAELVDLRTNDAFVDAVPAHFEGDAAGQARADEVLAWLSSLAVAEAQRQTMKPDIHRPELEARRARICARYSSSVIVPAVPASTCAPRRSIS